MAPGRRPVSIPNLEAKPGRGDGTSVGRPRESSTLPHYSSGGVLDSYQRVRHPPFFVLLVVLPDQPTQKQKHMSLETAVPRPACRAFAVKARTGSVRITRGEAVQDFWKTMPSRWLLTKQSLRDSGSRRGANPILPD